MAEDPSEDPPMEMLAIGSEESSETGAVGHQSAATKPAKKVHCCMHNYTSCLYNNYNGVFILLWYALLFMQGKKKRKGTKNGPTLVGGVSQTEGQLLTAQNRQELIETSSDYQPADIHDFWDTQPVPKLGT